ncbi:sensor histidine kinase [Lacticaseibacillus jixiensis]|uniref:sensor histidine kinase n=1 Tax=Lacticaseibacillus jixiensis TaxID=3231926 RepID=UPI0036F42470
MFVLKSTNAILKCRRNFCAKAAAFSSEKIVCSPRNMRYSDYTLKSLYKDDLGVTLVIIVPSWLAVTGEIVYYLALSGMIIYVGKIHARGLLIGLLLLMPVMVVVSILDFLAFNLVYAALFALFRYRAWRHDPIRRNWELFSYFLVMLLGFTVIGSWSSLVIALFHPAFNSALGNEGIPLGTFSLIGNVVFVIVVVMVCRLLAKIVLTQREISIILPQLIFVVTTMVFVLEFLKVTEQQGVYQILILGFLLTQVGYSTQRTIAALRKDKQQAEIDATKKQLEAMSAYTQQLERSYQQTRKFRHDFKNLLIALKAPDNGAHTQYLAALSDYSDQVLSRSVLRFGDLTHVHLPALKTLIVTKLTVAEQHGIDIAFECMNDVDTLACDEITVIRIMGILLDNAIEASELAAQQRLRLLVIDSATDLELIVENTFAGKLPKLTQMKQNGFSTKGQGRGVGLANVEEMIQQHDQLSITNYVADDMYGTSVVIDKGRTE